MLSPSALLVIVLFWVTSVYGACTNPRVRKEWSSLTSDEQTSYLNAVQCSQKLPPVTHFNGVKSRFDDFTGLHIDQFQSVHWVAQFFPFHRLFVWEFEEMLVNQCGYQGALPYWDETKDAGHFANADIFKDTAFGGNGDSSTNCVTTGPFANYTLHLGPGDAVEDHCLNRQFDEGTSAMVTQAALEQCHNILNFADFWVCIEWNVHTWGHQGVGGEMYTGKSSANDPIFYIHHALIDKQWWTWQNANGGSRKFEIAGRTDINDEGGKTSITPDLKLSMAELGNAPFVQDVLDTEGDFLCYRYE